LYPKAFARNLLILIFIVTCAGCAYVPVKTKPAEKPPASPNLTMLMGRYEELRGNWSQALAYYSEVNDPYATLALARVYFILNDNDNAMAMLQKVLDEGTYTGEALEMRTKIHARNGNWQKAIQDTEVLIKKYPDNNQLKLFLANLKIITGDFKDSRAILQGLVGTGDDSIIYYTIAKTCMGERNFKCVKDNLKKAIEARQDFTPAYLELAKTHDLLSEPDEALKVYQKLLDIDPLSSDANLALVDHFIQQKNYKQAIAHLKSFLETFPDSILLRKLIVLELQEGMYNDALDLIKGLKEVTDDDRYYLALAYAGLERYDDALHTLQDLPVTGRLGCDVVMLKSSILKNTGKVKESVAVLESAWKEFVELGTCNEIGYQLATEMDIVGRREEGLAIAMKLLEKDPHDPVALNFVGYVWADQGTNLDGAYKMIKEALEMKPDDPFILDSMGWVLYRMGRTKEALTTMEKALNLMKDDPVINEHMGDILKSMGRNEKALDYYLKASILSKNPNKEIKGKIEKVLKPKKDGVQ